MIQTHQKTFGIRVTDAESRAEPRPKCGRIMRARRARLPQIRHRKMRLVRRRDAAHFAESAANGFGARLFDAQIRTAGTPLQYPKVFPGSGQIRMSE